jgi:FlaA1/EpsC-like NDP-sugar epimerase
MKIPLSVITIEFGLTLIGTLGVRMARRIHFEMRERERLGENIGNASRKRVLLIGAGNAGNIVVKELRQRTDLGFDVVGFVDDDPAKFNTLIQGIKVLGNSSRIPELVEKHNIQEAIITIANASSKEIRRIAALCRGMKIKVKIVPGLYEMLDDKIKITKIREINIDDLLGRNIISFDNQLPEVISQYQNKKILISGAGGSIGSELCRQLSVLFPKELILVDKDENSIYEIDLELSSPAKKYAVAPIIANIKNLDRMRFIFERYKPQVVFHAAAHKHVPLMENNISEAILNNVIGTHNLVQLSCENSVERFIFISTDKAINPTSIMGATKKIGEIIVQEIATKNATRFSCVRFGNVLGSRGSVVPLFQKQIANGGPITLTHQDMRRYFMSIAEAVQLIIQAGTLGNKGEIFVLDMGTPIKIADLAKELIKLSGHREDDIDIEIVGLRRGEKLYEEILVDEERERATHFKKIFIAPPAEIDKDKFWNKLEELLRAAKNNDDLRIMNILKEIEIGYQGLQNPEAIH